MSINIRDDRHLRSLTGVSQAQFDILLDTFVLVQCQMDTGHKK